MISPAFARRPEVAHAQALRVVRLPNGRPCRLSTYAGAWQKLKTLPPSTQVAGFQPFPEGAAEVLASIRRGLDDRINRHVPWFGRGRKWQSDYQVAMQRDARRVQQILTQRIRVYGFESKEATSRFRHLLARTDD